MPVAALKAASFEALRAEADVRAGARSRLDDAKGEAVSERLDRRSVLPFDIAAIDDALPDGGLPRGSVIEVTSHFGLGRATSFALAACAAAQRLAKLRSGDDRTVGAWCAFLDPWGTLHAPGAARVGVDLDRLLVLRSPVDAIGRVTVRAASSRAFSMIVVDTKAFDPRHAAAAEGQARGATRAPSMDKWVNTVRRIAIAIEGSDTNVLLLTDASVHRAAALPVALRLELDVTAAPSGSSLPADPRSHAVRSLPRPPVFPSAMQELRTPPRPREPLRPIQTLRVAKDRRGRVSGPIAIAS